MTLSRGPVASMVPVPVPMVGGLQPLALAPGKLQALRSLSSVHCVQLREGAVNDVGRLLQDAVAMGTRC